MSARAKLALDAAIENRVGADGWFWWSREKWAESTGLSKSTIDRALRDLLASGLITKQSFRRPPGGPHGGKTSTPNLRLDPALLAPTGDVSVTRPASGDIGNDEPATGDVSVTRGTGDVNLTRQERRRGTESSTTGEPDEFREVMASVNGAEPHGAQRQMFLDAYLAAPEGWKQLMATVKTSRNANNRWAVADAAIKSGVHLQMQEQTTKPKAKAVCPECEVGGGAHVEGCSLAPKSGVVA